MTSSTGARVKPNRTHRRVKLARPVPLRSELEVAMWSELEAVGVNSLLARGLVVCGSRWIRHISSDCGSRHFEFQTGSKVLIKPGGSVDDHLTRILHPGCGPNLFHSFTTDQS